MAASSSNFSSACLIGFGIIWIGICLTIGAFFTQFAEMWPSGTPGLSPSMIVWIPYAMSVIGVLIIISGVRQSIKMKKTPPVFRDTGPSVVDPWAQKSSSSSTSGYSGEEVLDVPDTCPHCQAPLTEEGVEWVGPLSFKCPSCGSTVRVQRRNI